MNTGCVFVGTVFIAYGYYIMSAGGVRTGSRCIEDLSKVFAVHLQCSAGEWIHVVHEAYGDGDNATCRLTSAGSCSRRFISSQKSLVVNCNGKQSCREAMTVQPMNNCNITDAAAEVKYNCIKGSMNMCSPVTTTVNGSVYLHSPGFPDSVGVNSMCLLRITGKTLQVTLLEQYMRSGILNISGDRGQLWTNVYVGQFNRILPGQAAEIVIVYGNHDKNGSNLWIRVADSGQMNITIGKEYIGSRRFGHNKNGNYDTCTICNYCVLFAAVTSTHRRTTTHSTGNTARPRPSKSTTEVLTTDMSDSEGVVIALSVVSGILVLIIVVLVIYFMVGKPFRKKHATSSNTETTVGHGEVNVYDGIQQKTSNASDEHNYDHITSSGGPVYANSVFGDGPYVNT